MKKYLFFAAFILVVAPVANAQNDTLYIMKNGIVAGKYNINTQIDSIIFHQPVTPGNTFTDSRDGNVYRTITIGSQVWMAENLRYLPSVSGPAAGSKTTPYYYVYGYNGTDVNAAKATANYAIYGVLYNWAAAMAGSTSSSANPSGVQGVSPPGWHLPSDAEWTQLNDYLGGTSIAGGKLKEAGIIHWTTPNTGASNITGFTALPGGLRDWVEVFDKLTNSGYWWCSTDRDSNIARYRSMYFDGEGLIRSEGSKQQGYSVRCVKD